MIDAHADGSDDSGTAHGPNGAARTLHVAILGDPNSIHVRRWVEYVTGLGHRVTLLVPRGLALDPPCADGVEIARYSAQGSWRISRLGMIATGLSLRRVIAGLHPDLLQVHYLTRHGFWAWMSGFHPWAVSVWGSDVLLDAKAGRMSRLLARLALRSADLVTGGSDHLVRAAVAAGARPERTAYVHMGVDTDAFSPGPASADLRARAGTAGSRVILSPRAIAPVYRQDVVLEAFSRLPSDTVLVLTRFGAREAELAGFQARVAALGVAGRVRILPALPADDVPDLYRLADVVVSVPLSDGGPQTIVEALACGRPVVASDLPPVREWLDVLDPGALVPVGDVEATARAIERALARDAVERDERGAKARAAVVARAGRAATVARIDALYRQLVRRG
jgi:glycosyltransferase involved in cell wall biosynthesis